MKLDFLSDKVGSMSSSRLNGSVVTLIICIGFCVAVPWGFYSKDSDLLKSLFNTMCLYGGGLFGFKGIEKFSSNGKKKDSINSNS